MELEILLIFDRERFWRRAKLDLDSLPSSAAEMPESILCRRTLYRRDAFCIFSLHPVGVLVSWGCGVGS